MSKVIAEISMSLDGFVTDPQASVGTALEGHDPGRLHDWRFSAKTATDAAIAEQTNATTGAVVIGRRMFEVGFEPWGDPPPFRMPVFVVTHHVRPALPMKGETTYHFVGGLEAALAQARVAAAGKNVGVWGGADLIRQSLRSGWLDELKLHVAPVLLGGGVRLFEAFDARGIRLRKAHSVDTPGATHLRFDVLK